jgi:hypothetical protein
VIGAVAVTSLAVFVATATARGTAAEVACSSPGACPAIASVLPSALPFNRSSDTTLTVSGSRLDVVSSVLLEPGDAALVFQLQAADHMSVTLPTGVSAGDHWLVLSSPFGDSDHAPPPEFQVIAQSLAPQPDQPAVSFDPAPGASPTPASTDSSSPSPSATPAARVAAAVAPGSGGPWGRVSVAVVGGAAALALIGGLTVAVLRRRRHRGVQTAPDEGPSEEVVDARLERV